MTRVYGLGSTEDSERREGRRRELVYLCSFARPEEAVSGAANVGGAEDRSGEWRVFGGFLNRHRRERRAEEGIRPLEYAAEKF